MIPELERLLKAMDALFGAQDRGIHPVVFRRAVGQSLVPMIDDGMHRCKSCTDKLLEVSDAYNAFKAHDSWSGFSGISGFSGTKR